MAAVDDRRQTRQRVARRRHRWCDAVLAGERSGHVERHVGRRPERLRSSISTAPLRHQQRRASNRFATSSREGSTKNIENTLTWLKGSHSLSFGGAFTQADSLAGEPDARADDQLRCRQRRPGRCDVHATNFPGASTAQLNNARGLFAMLTGRVSAIARQRPVERGRGQYVYLGLGRRRAACASSGSSRRTSGVCARTSR